MNTWLTISVDKSENNSFKSNGKENIFLWDNFIVFNILRWTICWYKVLALFCMLCMGYYQPTICVCLWWNRPAALWGLIRYSTECIVTLLMHQSMQIWFATKLPMCFKLQHWLWAIKSLIVWAIHLVVWFHFQYITLLPSLS